MDAKALGRWGEDRAADFLKSKGFTLLARNYACRFGELDIVAEDASFLVFAEVKLRRNDRFALAREAVTLSKQRKILSAAKCWLACHPTERQPRFDVIEVYAPFGIDGRAEICHIANAFEGS